VDPQAVVLSATTPEILAPIRGDLTALARERTVAVAGAGATGDPPAGVLALTGDPVSEATRMTAA
jgi:hypothetical protein